MSLEIGDFAPDFELPAVAGEERIVVRSRDYVGMQHVVITFHPLDWTPT
jgi:peroxiredoxin